MLFRSDAVAALRTAGVPSLSLDLVYGIPGERESDLARDLAVLDELRPDHVSAYELEAKPGTRFAIHHGTALAEQADLLERHYDLVIDSLSASGYDWYEVASFARAPDHQGLHNRAYWEGREYLGLGVGAVSTVAGERRTNGPKLAAYLAGFDTVASAASFLVYQLLRHPECLERVREEYRALPRDAAGHEIGRAHV